MDTVKAGYVIRYYGHLMTMQERLAHRHLIGTAKATRGRTDAVAQNEVENTSRPARDSLSNDPEVLQLASDGIDAFMVRTAQRILDKHSDEIAFNYCPRLSGRVPVVVAETTLSGFRRLGQRTVARI